MGGWKMADVSWRETTGIRGGREQLGEDPRWAAIKADAVGARERLGGSALWAFQEGCGDRQEIHQEGRGLRRCSGRLVPDEYSMDSRISQGQPHLHPR